MPGVAGLAPDYAQRSFDPTLREGRWATLASPDGVDGSLAIRQQASLRGTQLGRGTAVEHGLDPARQYRLHVVEGAIDADGLPLSAGDAIGISGASGLLRWSGAGAGVADLSLSDLPRWRGVAAALPGRGRAVRAPRPRRSGLECAGSSRMPYTP